MASDSSSASSPSSVSFSRSSSIGSDGWEVVDWAKKSGKELFFKELHFDENVVLEMDYFECPACTPRPRTAAAAAGDKPPCTCTGTSARSSRVPPALGRAPSKKFKDFVGDRPRPMIIADVQDSIPQVLFMKSDQENKIVSMAMVSPRTPGSRGSSSEPLKENNFYSVSLISPRTPRTPMIPRALPKSPLVDPDQTKERKLTQSASRRPPKSPSSKWMAVPEEIEAMSENRGSVSSIESMISPKNRAGLGIIITRTELESAEEEIFPGFPPTNGGAAKPDFEPEELTDTTNYVGFGVLSPRLPRIIEGLSPVCGARDEEEAADDDQMKEEEKQEVPEEEAAAEDDIDDEKKKVNERGQNMLGGIGALASIGVAAAAMAVIVLGGGNQARAKSSSIGAGTGRSSRQKRN